MKHLTIRSIVLNDNYFLFKRKEEKTMKEELIMKEELMMNVEIFDEELWEDVMSDWFPNSYTDEEIADELDDIWND